ncbi:MAG: ABC transporter substrate-binding protein [Clostridiales bacterium]|jgi:NitT/TauT family transport system substrate-binding protein|nr:ABC transporter substrate-binding protein [Clostridiales bacterium]
MKKSFLKIIALSLAAASLSASLIGCSEASKRDGAGLPTIKIGLIVQDAVRPGLIVAAEELGYYKEEGVNVEFVSVDSVPSGIAAVETGKVDIFPFSVMMLSSIAKGSDGAFIAGTATEGSSLVAGKNSLDVDWTDWTQWKGKKIGATPTSPITYLLLQYIKDQDPTFNEDDVQWLEFDDNNVLLEALAKGEVDAGLLTTERVWLAEERGLREAFDVAEFLPEYLCCRQQTTLSTIEEKRDALVSVLRAQIRTEWDYKNDTEKVLKAVADYTTQDYDKVKRYIGEAKDYNFTGLTNFRNPVSTNPMYNKIVQYDKVSITCGYYQPNEDVNLKDHVDLSLYEDALNQLIEKNSNDETYKQILKIFKQDSSEYWI